MFRLNPAADGTRLGVRDERDRVSVAIADKGLCKAVACKVKGKNECTAGKQERRGRLKVERNER